MYETDPGRAVALILIGVYLGVGAMIFWKRQQDWMNAHCDAIGEVERRVFKLENPDFGPSDDAEES